MTQGKRDYSCITVHDQEHEKWFYGQHNRLTTKNSVLIYRDGRHNTHVNSQFWNLGYCSNFRCKIDDIEGFTNIWESSSRFGLKHSFSTSGENALVSYKKPR